MKRSEINKLLKAIKKELPKLCEICKLPACDAAHLLPRSLFPEHIINPLNVVALCRRCHTQFDDVPSFRHFQTRLYDRAAKIDKLGADRYFQKNNVEIYLF